MYADQLVVSFGLSRLQVSQLSLFLTILNFFISMKILEFLTRISVRYVSRFGKIIEWYGEIYRHSVVFLFSTLSKSMYSPGARISNAFLGTRCTRGPFCSPPLLTADHCSLFAGFLRSFVRNTVAENSTWSMVTGFTVHWIVNWMLLVVRGASSPKNGSNWSFPFSRVIPVFPIENFSSCFVEEKLGNLCHDRERRQTIEVDRDFIKIFRLSLQK